MTCPRCELRLYPDTDPEYGWCLVHGSMFLGTPPTPLGKKEHGPRINVARPSERSTSARSREREAQVKRLLAEGLKVSQVAERLGINKRWVYYYEDRSVT